MAEEHVGVLRFPTAGVKVECRELDNARELAGIVSSELRQGDVILLDGALAAGKTAFVSFVCQALNCFDQPSSPTYVISNIYKCPKFDIIHIDAYRLKGLDEFYHLGIEEFFPECVTLIEWGDRVAQAFSSYLRIQIDFINPLEEGRIYRFAGVGTRWQPLIAKLAVRPLRIS